MDIAKIVNAVNLSTVGEANIADTVKAEMFSSDADIVSIGKSVAGEKIFAAHRGDYNGGQIIITAAIHARECCTALAVLRQIRDYKDVGGVYFIPLVNPDGARFFCGENFDSDSYPILNARRDDRLKWKANIEGVDLNCNFDASWGSGKSNRLTPAPSDFIGNYPLCAPETKALVEFTEKVKPIFTLSYHCMGGELYWEFGQAGKRRERDEVIAAAIAKKIRVKKTDGHLFSAGGYKDYCIERLKIPSVTVELIRRGTHPFYARDIAEDAELNARLPEYIIKLMRRS